MILSALALSPMVVIASRRIEGGKKKDALLGTIIFGFEVVSFVFIFAAAVISEFIQWPIVEFMVFLAGGLASELQRRINYIHSRIYHDLIGGAIAVMGSIGALFLIASSGSLTLSKIYLVLGLVSITWAIQSGWTYWFRPSLSFDSKGLVEIWRIGKWGLGTNLAGFVYTQASTFLTLGLIGTAGVAVLELGRQLVLPIQVFLMGTANIWQTKLARSAGKNPPYHFRSEVWQITWIQTVIGTIFLLTILTLSPYLLPWIVPGKEQVYAESQTVAWILAGAAICQLLWQHPSFGVVALGKPEYGFATRCVTSIFLLPFGYVLTKGFGVTGAAWSRVLGEFSVLTLSVIMLNRAVNDYEGNKMFIEEVVGGNVSQSAD